MNKYYKYIIFIVLVGIVSCYDPTEDIPTVCFTLSRDTLQVGDTLYLYDCSDCRGITVQWGDSVKSYTDSYTYDKGQSGNHTFRHIYGDTGRFVIRVSVLTLRIRS